MTPSWGISRPSESRPNAIGIRMMKTAIVARPPRTSGESGCSRCQLSGGVALTGPPPAPHRARPGCRAGERPPRAPGRDARVRRRRGRVQAHGRQAEGALERAGRHVDELHPAVRHDRQAREHHAAPDEQVVLPLRVAPRAVAPPDERQRDRARARVPRPRSRRRQLDPEIAPTTASPTAASRAGPPTSSRRNVSSCREGVRHSSGSTPTASGPSRARTGDLRAASATLSQLSYGPLGRSSVAA